MTFAGQADEGVAAQQFLLGSQSAASSLSMWAGQTLPGGSGGWKMKKFFKCKGNKLLLCKNIFSKTSSHPCIKHAPPIGCLALTHGAFPMEECSNGAFLSQTRGMWALAVNDKLHQSEYAIYLITTGDY